MKLLPLIEKNIDIELLKSLNVDVIFTPEEEEENPFDQFEEKEVAEKICKEYDKGNFAAWFCAKVTVKYRDMEETDYLGCCSYNSFNEFTNADEDYYCDMVNNCINQINKEIQAANEDTRKKWNIRKAKNLIAPYNLYIVSNNVLNTL